MSLTSQNVTLQRREVTARRGVSFQITNDSSQHSVALSWALCDNSTASRPGSDAGECLSPRRIALILKRLCHAKPAPDLAQRARQSSFTRIPKCFETPK